MYFWHVCVRVLDLAKIDFVLLTFNFQVCHTSTGSTLTGSTSTGSLWTGSTLTGSTSTGFTLPAYFDDFFDNLLR